MSDQVQVIEGHFQNAQGKYTLVVSRFNSFVVEPLLQGALDTLRRHGIPEANIKVVKVPCAYEFTISFQQVVQTINPVALIALGAVIRGSTPHFDYVAGEAAKGLAQVSLASSTPVCFGVITTDTIEQAIERSGCKAGNKGSEAALTAIEMVSLRAAMAHVK